MATRSPFLRLRFRRGQMDLERDQLGVTRLQSWKPRRSGRLGDCDLRGTWHVVSLSTPLVGLHCISEF